MQKKWNELLKGAIELHAHSSPSIFPRRQNDWELVEDVRSAGMSGIVLKAHEGVSYDRAKLIQEKYSDIKIYGGLVCNHFVGGLNVYAVNLALRMGADIIWMPTLSTAQHKNYFKNNSKENILNSKENILSTDETISILKNGVVKENVKQILELIANENKVLATGHLSSEEAYKLVLEAKRIGVKKILIQHVDLGISPYNLSEQKQLASEGCFLEKCYLACSDDFSDLNIQDMAESIREVGVENCVLVTDFGQKHNKPVVEALNDFINELQSNNINNTDIKQMVVNNPRILMESK